jgi:Fe-coproporphyrin III synthase
VKLSQVPYFLSFALRHALGRTLPAVAGISITDVCNLDCAYCWRHNGGKGHVPYPKIAASLRRLYAMGARYLYFQGGEAFAWSDGRLRLRDVVAEAKSLGFFHVAVCTNGTFPLDAEPDSYSVSLDGPPGSHDAARSGSHARVMKTIEASRHPKLFLNATFHRRNAQDLPYLAELAANHPRILGLMVNFHIPYPGVGELTLSQEERARIARQALELKKEGYPILNTRAGLKALERNDWRRPIAASVVTNCEDTYVCCRAYGQEKVCRNCGYAVWAELSRVLSWDMGALWESFSKLHS